MALAVEQVCQRERLALSPNALARKYGLDREKELPTHDFVRVVIDTFKGPVSHLEQRQVGRRTNLQRTLVLEDGENVR
jgi:hypothetical protein